MAAHRSSPGYRGAADDKTVPLFSSHIVRPKLASRGSSTSSKSSFSSLRARHFDITVWKARKLHKHEAPVLMIVFLVLGFGLSLAHCIFYPSLNGWIVGDKKEQQTKLRIGTTLASVAQIALAASVWKSYTQLLWRAVYRQSWTANGLNKAFAADTAPWAILSREVFKNFKLGTFMAIFAWCLLIPPFLTPASLYVYPSTDRSVASEMVPYLTISNSSAGHQYAYSPPHNEDDTPKEMLDTTRIFSGPRTVLSLLSGATASSARILPLGAPSNHSRYSIDFFGPLVQCNAANASVVPIIDRLLEEHMKVRKGTANQIDNGYYGFVPAYDGKNEIYALAEPRYQGPTTAVNELWMTFQRWSWDEPGKPKSVRTRQVCRLYNATYNLDLQWDRNIQNVSGQATALNEVTIPHDRPGSVSNMDVHAYSAFMWSLTNQLVGSFGWFEEIDTPTGSRAKLPRYGAMESPIQNTGLLGSSDLDMFFNFKHRYKLYADDEDKDTSGQRKHDKNLARNETLAVLIRELSFNTTVSMLQNNLLTANAPREVTRWREVNRYGYIPSSLFVPHVLANLVALVAVILGLVSCAKDGTYPDKTFQDIANAAGDPHIIKIINDENTSDPNPVKRMSVFQQGNQYSARQYSMSAPPKGWV